MSSSWKTHGRSFKSLVKVNKFPQVDVRADDRGHAPVLRNNFQIYNLPDASGTGAAATTSNSKLEFGKYDFGIEASNSEIILNGIGQEFKILIGYLLIVIAISPWIGGLALKLKYR